MFERTVLRGSLLALTAALCFASSASLQAQSAPAAVPGPTTLQGAAFGQTVALSWTPAAGATSYEIAVGVQSNSYLFIQNVGATTTVSVDAPAGVYHVRVAGRNAEGIGQPSNEVSILVAPSALPRPAAPVGLQAQVLGQTVLLSWQLGPGGGPVSGLVFGAGGSPGANDHGYFPLPVTTQASTSVPVGTYFARVYAVGPGGASDPSNEVTVSVGGGGCEPPAAAPTASANVSGSNVVLSWTAVAGVAGYRVDVSMSPGGPLVASQPVGAGTTSVAANGIAAGTYFVKIAAITPCGTEVIGPEAAVTVEQQTGGRTPDPPPGQRLPLPNVLSVVEQVAREYPGDLRNSCREHGGNNAWLFRLVQRLRLSDTRWGLNWKRGNRGDMSQDVINYHWGPGPDEDSRDTYVVDVIAGHCGSNPGPTFNNVTGVGGADARWTLLPYTQAGFQP